MWAVCRWLLPALAPCFGPTLACLSCSVTKGKSELGPSYVISCVGCAAPEISPYKYSHHYIVRQHRQPSWRTGACGGGGAGDFVMSASPCVSRVCVCVCARTYTHTHAHASLAALPCPNGRFGQALTVSFPLRPSAPQETLNTNAGLRYTIPSVDTTRTYCSLENLINTFR